MSNILYNEIPSLDLADFNSGDSEKKKYLIKMVGDIHRNIGSVAVKNHGLSGNLTKKLHASVQKFFVLPDETKQKNEKKELAAQRGYIGKGREKAKGRSTGDLEELHHVFFTRPISTMDPICFGIRTDAENPQPHEEVIAGKFLDEKLRKIGLKA